MSENALSSSSTSCFTVTRAEFIYYHACVADWPLLLLNWLAFPQMRQISSVKLWSIDLERKYGGDYIEDVL